MAERLPSLGKTAAGARVAILESMRPYGRGPHIYIAAVHPGYKELLTRYSARRGASTGRITLVLAPLL